MTDVSIASERRERHTADRPGPRRRHARTPWGYAIRSTLRGFSRDRCTDLAASLTYFGVLSIFPALLALISILGLIGQREAGTQAILNVAEEFAPGSTLSLIRGPLEQFSSSSVIGLGVVVGILGAVWSASGYVGAFGRALNRIHGVGEGRGGVRLRGMQLAVTLSTLILVTVITLILVVSGPVSRALGAGLGVGDSIETVWAVFKWPVLACALVLVIAILFGVTPNVRRRFRLLSPGACAAVVILGVATLGFGFYIANFSHYDKTYGSLAGVIIFLLWIWIANLALLVGAELDIAVEHARDLVAGRAPAGERRPALKSEKGIRKAEDRRAEEILTERRISESAR